MRYHRRQLEANSRHTPHSKLTPRSAIKRLRREQQRRQDKHEARTLQQTLDFRADGAGRCDVQGQRKHQHLRRRQPCDHNSQQINPAHLRIDSRVVARHSAGVVSGALDRALQLAARYLLWIECDVRGVGSEIDARLHHPGHPAQALFDHQCARTAHHAANRKLQMRTGRGGGLDGGRARFGLGGDRRIQQCAVAATRLRQEQLFRDKRAAVAAKRAHRCADGALYHPQTCQRITTLIARRGNAFRVGAGQRRHFGFADQFRRHLQAVECNRDAHR